MNDNDISYISQATKLAVNIVEQIQSWPSAVLLGVCLIIVGGALKMIAVFPNRAIPAVVLLLGSSINILIGNPGDVSPEVRYPSVILGMWGFCVAFAAWMAHFWILKRFEKYLPILNGKSGNTEIIEKPKA